MDSGFEYEINITGDFLEIMKKLQASADKLDSEFAGVNQNMKSGFKGVGDALKSVNIVSFTESLKNMGNTIKGITQPNIEFETSLAELSAITGITGDGLDNLGDKARSNAKKFGGDAAKSVDVYKLLLSQLGPELADKPEILGAMADSVSVLSKTMGGDTTGAVEVLTTAMNQYGVSIDDPVKAQEELNRMMNAMAAGAKQGSAEFPALKAAIQNVGGDAKSSGLSFEEMVSGVEALDKAGKKGAEGGVALRNVLSSLNQGRFLPKDVQAELLGAGVDMEGLSDKTLSFTDRLELLKPIAGDAALLSKLFGKENKLSAEALIGSIDAQNKMTEQITGTNTATDQANIMMDTQAEKLSRVSAWFNDVKISIGNATQGFTPFLEIGLSSLEGLSTIVPAINGITKAVKFMRSEKTKAFILDKSKLIWDKAKLVWDGVFTASQWLMNTALIAGAVAMTILTSPITLIVLGIAALTAGVIWAYNEFEGFRNVIDAIIAPIKEAIKWIGSLFGAVDDADGKVVGVKVEKTEEVKKVSKNGYEDSNLSFGELTNGGIPSLEPTFKPLTPEELRGKKNTMNDIVVPDANKTPPTPKSTANTDSSTVDAIATGGKKQTILNIQIDKVVETINQHISEGKESAEELVDMVLEGLTRRLHGTFKAVGQ